MTMIQSGCVHCLGVGVGVFDFEARLTSINGRYLEAIIIINNREGPTNKFPSDKFCF